MSSVYGAIITEKSMKNAGDGVFSFMVDKRSTKNDIRKDVEKAFGVNVVSVATVTQKGKTQRSGSRRTERTLTPFKKAFVTVKKGQKIGLFELGESK